MSTVAREADGLFINKFSENKLTSPVEQQRLLASDQPPPSGTALPEMWLHYDDDLGRVGLWEGEAPPMPNDVAAGGAGSSSDRAGAEEPPTAPAAAPLAAPINPFANA